jgi:uncharacterized protein with HEPN domain
MRCRKGDDAKAARFPNIPFGDIRATRNRIAQDYNRVNFRIVWGISQIDIPPLISTLQEFFSKRPSS